MGDDQALGPRHLRLQVRRLIARGRRGDDCVSIGRLELGIDAVLQLDPLRHGLDDQPGAFDRLGDRPRQPPVPLRRPGCLGQLGIGALGVLQHRAHLAPGLGVGVEDADLEAVLDQPGEPPAPITPPPRMAARPISMMPLPPAEPFLTPGRAAPPARIPARPARQPSVMRARARRPSPRPPGTAARVSARAPAGWPTRARCRGGRSPPPPRRRGSRASRAADRPAFR